MSFSTLRRRFALILAVLLTALLGTYCWQELHEPSYNGKRLSVVLRDLRDVSPVVSENPELDALIKIGPACLPYLIRQLELKDSSLENLYRRMWAKSPEAFQNRFPLGLTRAERRATAAFALWQIGPGAFSAAPALVKALSDPNANVRREAASALWVFPVLSPSVVAALVLALKDPSVQERSMAALEHINCKPLSIIPQLIRFLKDPNLAGEAARCLGSFGPDAREAVPSLLDAAKHGAAGDVSRIRFLVPEYRRYNREHAVKALGQIGVSSESIVTILADFASDPNEEDWVRHHALEALGLLKARPELILRVTKPLLVTADSKLRWMAYSVLANLGPKAAEAVPLLTSIMQQPLSSDDEERRLQMRAAVALCRISPVSASLAVPFFIDQLDRGSWLGADTLLLIQTNATPAQLTQLRQIMKLSKMRTKCWAALLVSKLDPLDPEPLNLIRQAASGTNHAEGSHAAFCLWKMTGETQPSLSVLTQLLQGGSHDSLEYLAQMGDAAKPAEPALKQALWSNDLSRRTVGEILFKLDPQFFQVQEHVDEK